MASTLVPTITVTAPSVQATLPPAPITRSTQAVAIDPKLLKTLLGYAAKHPDALRGILDKVPESTRQALLEAIAITDSYQQALSALAASAP